MANVAHQSRVAGRGSQEPASREPQPAAERGPATRTMASKARRVHSRPRQDALPRPDKPRCRTCSVLRRAPRPEDPAQDDVRAPCTSFAQWKPRTSTGRERPT